MVVPGMELNAEALAAVAPDSVIDEIIRSLGAFAPRKDLEKYNGIGSIVINKGYAGSFEAWRKRGKKDPTYRKIIQHENLPISAVDVFRGVGTYELWSRFDRLKSHPAVTATHIRYLLGMEPDEQKNWMDKIQGEGWTVQKLQDEIEIGRHSALEPEAAGALVEIRRQLRQIDLITDDKDGLVADLNRAGIPAEETAQLDTLLDGVAEQLKSLRARLAELAGPRKR